jgi:hypothetical protein
VLLFFITQRETEQKSLKTEKKYLNFAHDFAIMTPILYACKNGFVPFRYKDKKGQSGETNFIQRIIQVEV